MSQAFFITKPKGNPMSCFIQILLIIIAFYIHPVIGIVWLIAQLLGAYNKAGKEDE